MSLFKKLQEKRTAERVRKSERMHGFTMQAELSATIVSVRAAGRLCGGGLFLCKEVRLGRLHGPGCRSLFGPPLRRAVE